ncbi:GNAT family acetyltransferase [Heliocybe sulcata]|uniref:GNAT family acetyltransferase n=1 Tax=Heliocybe sulcata TaxID=5364 RepID=A0A5C3N212_9AGAM|nr:GNAT family acetyltransferase [Heliocybe sulcata]
MSSSKVYDNLNFCFPVRELSNDRLKLTPFVPSLHASEFFKVASQSQGLYAHVSKGPWTSDQEYVDEFVQGTVQNDPGMVMFAIIDKTKPATSYDPDGTLAGTITYMNSKAGHLSTEIGWVLVLPPFQRTHVTSNAVGLLLQYALDLPEQGGLALRRVEWQTSTANVPSQRAAERMGFQKEGVVRWAMRFQHGASKGKQGNGKEVPKGRGNGDDLGRDTVLYSLCWDDWEAGGREKIQAIMDRRA